MILSQLCPICNSKEYRTICVPLSDVYGNREIFTCQNCFHGWDLNLHVDLEQYYNKNYKMAFPPSFNIAFWRIAHYLETHYKNKKVKLIDIGSNNGRFLWHLPSDWVLYGVETALQSAEISEEYTNAKIFKTAIENVSVDKYGPYDVITSWAVIEHLMDPVSVIYELCNSLKRGGMLCVMTGDRTSLLAKASGLQWIMYGPAGHLHFFSEKSLERLLKDIGLKVIKKYWTTGNVANYNYKILNVFKQIFNVTYDMSPFTKIKSFDHMYFYAIKQ